MMNPTTSIGKIY